MAFEPNFEKVVASVRKNLGTVQSQVECRLPIEGEVKRIVCSNAKANIANVETSGKDIVYSGFVNFQIIYFGVNNEPVGVDYTAEFKEKHNSGMELNNVVPVVGVSVVDVNTMVNGDIKVVAILETTIDAIVNNSTNILTGINSDTYFTQKELLSYSNYLATASSKFEAINDIEIKDSVSKILSVCPSVYIEKVVPQDRYLMVNGGVYFDICYMTDNNMIRSHQASFEFNQEVAQDDIDEGSIIQSELQILYNDIKVTTSIDTDNAIVNVNLPLIFMGYVFKSNSVEVVSDLFSTSHYSNISVESLSTMQSFESVEFDEKLSGNVVIHENDAFIDEILGNCCGNVVVANSAIQDGKLVVEGVASTTVLYLNKEMKSIHSVEVEMPFSASTKVDLIDGLNTDVQIALTQISTRARRGKEIEVTATLELYCDIYNNLDSAVIVSVKEEDEIPESECAMSFYIARQGDTLWEIAKELKVSTNVLLAQNPTLSEPIQAGTRVVVYRQRQVEF